MRFLITAQPAEGSKTLPDEGLDMDLFAAYMKFNEEMAKAGVLVAAEGLLPSGVRARVAVSGGKRKVVDGPFAESKELLGGLYIIEVATKEEAIGWAMRCPVGLGSDDVLEIFQMTGADDLPAELNEAIAKVAPTWSASFKRGK